jgi:hypothetical protein
LRQSLPLAGYLGLLRYLRIYLRRLLTRQTMLHREQHLRQQTRRGR